MADSVRDMRRAPVAELLAAIGHDVRARRISVNLTQAELGKRAGLGGKYVSEIERGTRDLPISTLHAIVEDGLGLRLGVEFVNGKPPARSRDQRQVDDLVRRIGALPPPARASILTIIGALLRLTE